MGAAGMRSSQPSCCSASSCACLKACNMQRSPSDGRQGEQRTGGGRFPCGQRASGTACAPPRACHAAPPPASVASARASATRGSAIGPKCSGGHPLRRRRRRRVAHLSIQVSQLFARHQGNWTFSGGGSGRRGRKGDSSRGLLRRLCSHVAEHPLQRLTHLSGMSAGTLLWRQEVERGGSCRGFSEQAPRPAAA